MIHQRYETEHLILELSNAHLAQEVSDYLNRNRQFLAESEATRPDEYYTESYWRQKLLCDEESIGYIQKDSERAASIHLWIRQKELSHIIGMIGFHNIQRGAFLSCFISYRLDSQWVNRGLMSEALKKAVEIAFTDLGLHRIEANIMPKNKASIRVAEKLGFQNEGLARNYLKIGDKWEDHLHMVLLSEDV